jgi:hypothetical protein
MTLTQYVGQILALWEPGMPVFRLLSVKKN